MYVGDDLDPKTVRLPQDLLVVRRLVARLHRGRDARTGKIASLKRAIGDGDYENDLKLSVAMDRLLEDLPTNHENRK